MSHKFSLFQGPFPLIFNFVKSLLQQFLCTWWAPRTFSAGSAVFIWTFSNFCHKFEVEVCLCIRNKLLGSGEALLRVPGESQEAKSLKIRHTDMRKKNSSAKKSQILVNGIQNSTKETQNFRPRRELIIIYAHISTWKESCACCLIKKYYSTDELIFRAGIETQP